MVVSCSDSLPLYQPRDPHASDLWQLLDQHVDTFRQVYDERYQDKYGYWRPIVEQSVAAFLKCGDLQGGFARVRCPDCKHEMTSQWSCASNVCRVLKSSHAPSARKSVSPVTMRARLRATSGSLSRQINSAPINGVMIVNSSQGK
jgi:hypothetical protein